MGNMGCFFCAGLGRCDEPQGVVQRGYSKMPGQHIRKAQMTPKRLRLIASVIRRAGLVGGLPSTNEALAHELEEHADELEESQTIRLKEPGTVFGDLKAQAEKGR